MNAQLKVLLVDVHTGFYKVDRYKLGDFFGPVDLGLHLSGRLNSLNLGVGLLAGSIFPGCNRLVVTGFSPCWSGFFISSMGGAGLVFNNLGINMLSIIGSCNRSSILYLNRKHGEEIEVDLIPIDLENVWRQGRGGIYGLMDYVFEHFGSRYDNDPRILAVGPAAQATDIGAIGSVPIRNGKLTHVDTWAGRGGFGSKLLQQHGIAAIAYGGTFIEEDFRDRNVADQWFQDKYNQKLAAKDFEATTKYRFDPKFGTGGTFGVNYAAMGGRLLAFNYRSIYWDESERSAIQEQFVKNHYLKQFNEETIQGKQQRTCGEPCSAVCKKMHGQYKKDYEPYQVMGPLCGIFDQRAAEKLNHHADRYGFDAISIGGVLSWLMECLDAELLSPEELGVTRLPVFSPTDFRVVTDSMHNADLGVELLDSIVQSKCPIDFSMGARKVARRLARDKGKDILDRFVYTAYARGGWMVPNQYWTPGVLLPMAIMGKYYMYYGTDFVSPRALGQLCAERFRQELILDSMGFCRFHRNWAEDMLPDIMEALYGLKDGFLNNIDMTASRISSRNASVYWESERNIDYVYTYLKRIRDLSGSKEEELSKWIDLFEKNKNEAGLAFWYDVHKGVQESLREF
jgi:glyceraldehyde-3-phosphate dehydrogenase (ferredoxin)